MSRPFVLLFQGRTGSSLLRQCLNSHPDIHMLGEEPARILLESGVKRTGWLQSGRRKEVGRMQLAWMREFFESPQADGVLRHGFKTKLLDVFPRAEFSELLHAPECAVIHSARRNVVKLTVSGLNAMAHYKRTGRYNRIDSDPPLPLLPVPPRAFLAELKERVRREQTLARFIEGLSLPVLKVDYEDLLKDLPGQLEEICGFLEVPPAPMEARDRKNTNDDLRKALANFDAIQQALRGSPYEAMLEESGENPVV